VRETATELPSEMEIDTPEIARTARNSSESTRNTPPSRFNSTSSANNNTNISQQPTSLPTAVIRSNDASQDDQMPEGRVVGFAPSPTRELLAVHQQNVQAANLSSRELLAAHQQNVRATNLFRLALQEARRDSLERHALVRAIHGGPNSTTLPRPSSRRIIREQANVVQSGTFSNLDAPPPRLEVLAQLAATSPLASDPNINVWVHQDGYLVFDNMRTYDASESVVITQRVLESDRFYWSILSPLQGGQKWDV
jgi:hypothetical protein